MRGIEISDFEAFLKVLYAPQFSDSRPLPEVTLIIRAYRMAVLWEFSELQNYLFSLADRSFNDVDRIAFANAFELKEWLLSPHVNLCQREEPLSLDEAKKIGVDSLLIINNLREEFPPREVGGIPPIDHGYAVEYGNRPNRLGILQFIFHIQPRICTVPLAFQSIPGPLPKRSRIQ
ncbi:hypothetical protein OPQ81_000400 [Rhizoctonia solani]|nr:hypothetical protein OPQ81_000400 [Rhizoctonia solani]